MAFYNEADSRKLAPQIGILSSILGRFKDSDAFGDVASRTKADYMGKIELIEKEFGTLPLAALTDRRTRGVFREWRDKLARSSRRQADYAFAVLSLVLAWALEGGFVDANPCTRMGRLYGEARTDKIWNEKDEANFNARVVGLRWAVHPSHPIQERQQETAQEACAHCHPGRCPAEGRARCS